METYEQIHRTMAMSALATRQCCRAAVEG